MLIVMWVPRFRLQGRPQAESRHSYKISYYQSPTNLNFFYPVAERSGKPLSKSRSTGFGSEQPEFVERKRLQKKQYHKKKGGKSPLVKVLEILKNFFQEVFKWVRAKPEVFSTSIR